MEVVVLKMLFIISVSAQFGKHVYVKHNSSWQNAQRHCRNHYTDLSPITSSRDEARLKNATIGSVDSWFWIGLYKNATHWKWSGGGHATYTPWDADKPDNISHQTVACVCWKGCGWNGWHNVHFARQLPFFCFNLIVVEMKRTWEQALRYCRKTHTTLTSLASETEHLLALRKMQQDAITERVWIGLRYLDDRWQWVNGDPLVYQTWARGGDQDHQCPVYKRCGALTKDGVWENWDCQDKLNFICY